MDISKNDLAALTKLNDVVIRFDTERTDSLAVEIMAEIQNSYAFLKEFAEAHSIEIISLEDVETALGLQPSFDADMSTCVTEPYIGMPMYRVMRLEKERCLQTLKLFLALIVTKMNDLLRASLPKKTRKRTYVVEPEENDSANDDRLAGACFINEKDGLKFLYQEKKLKINWGRIKNTRSLMYQLLRGKENKFEIRDSITNGKARPSDIAKQANIDLRRLIREQVEYFPAEFNFFEIVDRRIICNVPLYGSAEEFDKRQIAELTKETFQKSNRH